MSSKRSASPADPAAPRPWWRERMMWLVVGGPGAIVLASIATLVLAITHPDPVIETRVEPSADMRQSQALEPAVKARNHAATGAAQPR
ncbi:MAG TPA: hypothetical protein VJN44_12345 [Roseateles sp.]|nr:hypothetical protein [Roseateles sp.]